MKPSKALRLAIFCTLAAVLSSRDVRQAKDAQLQTTEEREFVTTEELEKYLKEKDDVVGPVMDLALAGVGGLLTQSKIDYSKSGGHVAREVANAMGSVIGAALAFIPGVGPLVSGLFLGVWGLIAPLFAAKEHNPMERMINELAQNMEINMDEKLSSVINRAIYGEITRNNYICTKYNFMFSLYADQLNSNRNLAAYDALKLSGYLNDCDNFLKDTAEAFVYNEYADVLWVPSAIATSVRASFMTEVIKYGHLIGIEPKTTAMYFKELKNDIRRQFNLHHRGMNKLRQQLVKKSGYYVDGESYLIGISKVEEGACQVQSQLLYLDSELYPYGMPTVLNSTDLFAEIRMADHYNPDKDGKIKHLQVFFDVGEKTFPGVLPPSKREWYKTLKIMNCIMGPMYPRIPSYFWFKFSPMTSGRFSYEFRVMYFHTREYDHRPHPALVPILLPEIRSSNPEYMEYEETHRKLGMGNPAINGINLQIMFVRPVSPMAGGSKRVLEMPIVAHWERCPYEAHRGMTGTICDNGIKFYDGTFHMYSAGTYNVDNYKEINKLVRIGNPGLPLQRDSTALGYSFLVGVEIIMRPLIPKS